MEINILNNDRIYKEIYYPNGKLKKIKYFNNKRELHKEDGPALIVYNEDGSIKEEHWYINGEYIEIINLL